MAKATTLVDDLDGKPNATERHFSVEGLSYAVDLTEENYRKLLKALEPYRTVGRIARRTRQNYMPSLTPEQRKAIREFADSQGYTLAPRGRFPNRLIEEYLMAHKEAEDDLNLVDA